MAQGLRFESIPNFALHAHPASAVNILGHVDIRVPQNVRHSLQLRRRAASAAMRKLRKCPLTLESAGPEPLQRVVASIRGQNNGLRVCACEICHRLSYASVHGGQKIGVDVALMGPGLHRSHARDLSAIIDIASRDYEQVGIRGN